MAEEVVIAEPRDCDFHKKRGKSVQAKYDGKTVFGSWAYMCEEDWKAYGIGRLGTGYGQRLILGTKVDS